MKVIETPLDGVLILELDSYADERGFFLESYHQQRYEQLGIQSSFVQENHSRSTRGVLRGLHGQSQYPQGKLVRVVRGTVFDVVVEANPEAQAFGQWFGVELSDTNHRQLWIPPGYLHGFQVLSDIADIEYKCTEIYRPDDEIGLAWDDPMLKIEWPLENPVLSAKDQRWPNLQAR